MGIMGRAGIFGGNCRGAGRNGASLAKNRRRRTSRPAEVFSRSFAGCYRSYTARMAAGRMADHIAYAHFAGAVPYTGSSVGGCDSLAMGCALAQLMESPLG